MSLHIFDCVAPENKGKERDRVFLTLNFEHGLGHKKIRWIKKQHLKCTNANVETIHANLKNQKKTRTMHVFVLLEAFLKNHEGFYQRRGVNKALLLYFF